MDFAGDDALGLNFNAALGENYAVKPSSNNYLISFDLTFNFGAFAQNESLITEDVAFDLGFNAERAGKLQCAFKADSPIEKSGPFALRFRHASMI